MPKAKGTCMKGDQPLTLVVAPGTEWNSTAIQFVAKQRMAAAGALDANLVRAAGFEGDFEEGGRGRGIGGRGSGSGSRVRSIGSLNDAIVKNRIAAIWI